MMTVDEKLAMVKAILRIEGESEDALLTVYLESAKRELIGWRYSYAPVAPDDVPAEYEMTQIHAVVYGFTQSGVEGQTVSVENGIHRHFSYPDMVRYIRANVVAIARVSGTPTGGTPASDLRKQIFDDVVEYIGENALEVGR